MIISTMMFSEALCILAATLSIPSAIASCVRQVDTPCIVFQADSDRECFAAELAYSQTFIHTDLLADSSAWSFLRAIPRCWDRVQPLLCAIYKPRCNNSRVDLYPSGLCFQARDACRILVGVNESWPEFLQCSSNYFSKEQSCQVQTPY